MSQKNNSRTLSAMSDRPDLDTTAALETLHRLRVPGKGLHTSEGERYNNTLFARDSAIAARDLIEHDPTIAHEAILMLASHQGIGTNELSDEEPGRIHHEDRDFETWQAGPTKRVPLIAASLIWGGTTKEFTSYFSMDSTPLYALLVADYADAYPSILQETVVQGGERTVTITESLIAAADWMVSHKSANNLIEIARHNKYGLTHQTWKDSLTGYIHENGESLNLSQPIAYLEVQALTVYALARIADTLRKASPLKAAFWRRSAAQITEATLRNFWDEETHYFVSSIDRDKHGNLRKDGVAQSDPGWMLCTPIFDNLPPEDRQKYLTGIITTLFSDDFLTDAGIRSRSVEYAHILGVADYHGSLVSWPIDTYMAAKGLRHQGFPKLADQLEARILNSVNISGEFYEFFYVEPNGKVLLNPEAARTKHNGDLVLPVQMFPDKGIAWTVAATIMIRYHNKKRRSATRKPALWKSDLELDILARIPNISPIKAAKEVREKFAASPGIYLDFSKGFSQTMKSVWEAYHPRLPQSEQKPTPQSLKPHLIK